MASALVTKQATEGHHRINARQHSRLCTQLALPFALMTASTSAVAALQPGASSLSSRATRASPWPADRAAPDGLPRGRGPALQSGPPHPWIQPTHDRSADRTAAVLVLHCSGAPCNLVQETEATGACKLKGCCLPVGGSVSSLGDADAPPPGPDCCPATSAPPPARLAIVLPFLRVTAGSLLAG